MQLSLGNVGFGSAASNRPVILVLPSATGGNNATSYLAAHAAESNFLSTLRTGDQLGSRLNRLA